MAERTINIYESIKATGEIPQGWSNLGIEGRRDVDNRLELYNLPLKKDMKVLDIGCNVGFLSLAIAGKVGEVAGIDTNKNYIQIAQFARDHLKIKNANFMTGNYAKTSFQSHIFDLIISLQIHYWIKLDLVDYILKIRSELKPSGYLAFESNDVDTVDKDIDDKIDTIMKCGFEVMNEALYYEKNKPEWYTNPPDGLKPINRRFILFKLVQ